MDARAARSAGAIGLGHPRTARRKARVAAQPRLHAEADPPEQPDRAREGQARRPRRLEADADAISTAAKRDVTWLKPTLPLATPIRDAHDEGRSVWALPRRGCTLECLNGFDILANHIWTTSLGRKSTWPPMPSLAKTSIYVPGWDQDDDEA